MAKSPAIRQISGMIIQPEWPAKLTREQQKSVKQRRKDYCAALKAGARKAGWHFAQEQLFRQTDDWFISVMSSLLWERGARVRIMAKPMALDPLFWDIVGLSENENLPLSFRMNGAWVLRPAWEEHHVALETTDVTTLAAEVTDWSSRRANAILQTITLDSMLAALPAGPALFGQNLALAVCLNIMNGNHEAAMRLCGEESQRSDGGGFVTSNRDGTVSTFTDQATAWLAREQRSEPNAP